MRLFSGLLISAIVFAAVVCTGCHQASNNDNKTQQAKNTETKHDGWWCKEHGVPEHLCSLCLPEATVKKLYKDTGNWCEIHDRAKPQCFKCDPSKYKKFEDMYIAKFGKAPERPDDDEFKK